MRFRTWSWSRDDYHNIFPFVKKEKKHSAQFFWYNKHDKNVQQCSTRQAGGLITQPFLLSRVEGAGFTGSAAGFVNSRESVCGTDCCVSAAAFDTGNDSHCSTDRRCLRFRR